MGAPVISHPTLRVNPGGSLHEPCSVSACRLSQGLTAVLAASGRPSDLLKSVFRVVVAETPRLEGDGLPDVAGRYVLFDDEVRFVPTFPFDSDVKYRAIFDARPLGFLTVEPLMVEFELPSDQKPPEPTEVTHIFPSCDLLPENVLRFYVCFSNSMQRGRALGEISLFDSEGRPVADALYRPPCKCIRSFGKLGVPVLYEAVSNNEAQGNRRPSGERKSSRHAENKIKHFPPP